MHQLPLQFPEYSKEIIDLFFKILSENRQPSAHELVKEIEDNIGLKARWNIKSTIEDLTHNSKLPKTFKSYLISLIKSNELEVALEGGDAPKKNIESSIDILVHQSLIYRSSENFMEMIRFMAEFRDYAPYNNLLVKIQRPECNFYATEKDWQKRFGRRLKEDAKPMLILAPMHPVMLVYDLDQTEGKELPAELSDFAKFDGKLNRSWLDHIWENSERRDKIKMELKNLSSTNAGFATFAPAGGRYKMRIVIHNELNEPSIFGVLCHELAHIYLGHLGSDKDHWWPSRINLNNSCIEIEAEAVAYIVTTRLGLSGSSAAYISRLFKGAILPPGVSLDLIAKVSGRIEEMALKRLPSRRESNSIR